MPIEDLKAPDHKFMDKWQVTKTLLKNDLIEGKNIVIHCMGRKGSIRNHCCYSIN